jgi:hypothetical protein
MCSAKLPVGEIVQSGLQKIFYLGSHRGSEVDRPGYVMAAVSILAMHEVM